MRLLIFSALIFSISFGSINAQEFLPIVKEGAVWYQWSAQGTIWDGTYEDTNWYYEVVGDTVLDSLTYGKLMLVGGGGFWPWVPGCVGGLREDEGQVFFKSVFDTLSDPNWCFYVESPWMDSLDFTDEILIYDFNLNEGDTLYGRIVNLVDSVDLGDGYDRKRISFGWSDPLWIEGIGSSKGLLEGHCTEAQSEYVLNCYIDSSINYPDPCLNNSIWESGNEFNWSLTPNPATTSINIEIPNSERSELVIHNMFGEAVLRRRVSGDQQVDVIGLPPGLYSASLMQNGRSAGSQLLVIIN